MPINDVEDIAYLSGNGRNTGVPMQSLPSTSPFQEGYIENALVPATFGQLVRKVVSAANVSVNTFNLNSGGAIGGALAQKTAVLNEVFLSGEVGVVTQPAPSQSNQGIYTYQGIVLALCTTGTTPIAFSTLLSADGAGNLTPAAATPSTGTIVARAYGTVPANTTVPVLIPVFVGVS